MGTEYPGDHIDRIIGGVQLIEIGTGVAHIRQAVVGYTICRAIAQERIERWRVLHNHATGGSHYPAQDFRVVAPASLELENRHTFFYACKCQHFEWHTPGVISGILTGSIAVIERIVYQLGRTASGKGGKAGGKKTADSQDG